MVSIYDGDTLTVEVDLGFDVTMKRRLRLYGIDTFELRGSERKRGLRARDWLREKVLGKEVIFRSVRTSSGRYTGSFGRYLAVLYVDGLNAPGFKNINRWLIEEGHGVYKDY